jgi:hypothetical protein
MDVIPATAGDHYLTWWSATKSVEPGTLRWLNGARVAPLPGRGLLIHVEERRPLLRVESAGAGYWLCSDGSLERAQIDDHKLALFERIKRLPVARLDAMVPAQATQYASVLQSIAANCDAAMSGQIRYIVLNAKGEFSLIDSGGLEIRLGDGQQHELKIAALPKALRSTTEERSRMAYLDGSGRVQGSKFVYYAVLKEGSR